jgi:predicted ATPase/class 3 adenylate cyclase/DNA-binding CsgD family transcriptional regulator
MERPRLAVVKTADMSSPTPAPRRIELPEGTVTFLLTDVEGTSTAWEADPAATATALGHHHRILDDAIARHDGVRPEEQGEGESIVAAFALATDAAAAALDAQAALQAELGALFLVRMAIHTGEAEMRVDPGGTFHNYMGRAIIRATRLRACAHGGQILVSSAAAELVADHLPAGASLVDLGTHRLREVARAERVAQLVHPNLPSQFPPLRTLALLPQTLPTPLTSLVGREEDLMTVEAFVRSHPLVTLTGAGGIGKTRLAQQAAADLVDDHPDGTWWVDLAPAANADGVFAAFAAGVGTELQGGTAASQQIVTHLAGAGAVLVVVDNCEHVVGIVAPLVAAIVGASSTVSVVATSREALGLPGEQIWRVPSLGAPRLGDIVTAAELMSFDAATLFVDRARAGQPSLVVDDAAAVHIAAICSRLDGIPLAIELAAARVRTMSLARLAIGLDDEFRLLTGGARTSLPRQQTLRESVRWSFDLLDETERAVLRRLSVCPMAFDLGAAEAIAADREVVASAAVLDALARLVDTSLVEFDGAGDRYRMLGTIRQYGLERLRDAGEIEDTRRRHATYWSKQAIRLGRWGPTLDFPALRDALTDIIVMLDWAMTEDPDLADRVLGATAITAYGLGRWLDLERACDFVLADRARGAHWAEAVGEVAVLAPFVNRFDVWVLTAEAMDRALANQDTSTVHLLRVGAAMAAWATGDLSPVRALIADALAAGDDHPATIAGTALISGLIGYGQLDELAATCGLVERLCANAGQTVDDTVAGAGTCAVLYLGGDLETPCRRFPNRPILSQMIARAWAMAEARVALARNDLDLARSAARRLTPDDTLITAYVPHLVEGVRASIEHDYGRAAAAMARAVDVAAPAFVAPALLCEHAAILSTAGQHAASRAVLERLDTVLASTAEPAPLPRASALVLRSRLAAADGDAGAAERAAYEALEQASTAGLALVQIDALEAVATAMATHHPARAAGLLGAATAERARRGYDGRLSSGVSDELLARLAATEPTHWQRGAELTLENAVELAWRARGPRGRPSIGIEALTPTEQRVMEQVAIGRTNAEIAAGLGMTVPTVKTHLTHIFNKLGLRNRTEVSALASRERPAN